LLWQRNSKLDFVHFVNLNKLIIEGLDFLR